MVNVASGVSTTSSDRPCSATAAASPRTIATRSVPPVESASPSSADQRLRSALASEDDVAAGELELESDGSLGPLRGVAMALAPLTFHNRQRGVQSQVVALRAEA